MSLALVYASVCVFLAALVRGFSGFGFALLAITSLSFFLAPRTVVPAMFMLEVAAGIHLLPSIWRQVHWPAIGLLVGSAIVFTPIGMYALANYPADSIRLLLSAVVFLTAVAMLANFQLKRMPSTKLTIATGGLSGLLNGAFGISGPPIIIFFLGSPLALQVGRGSIIMVFLALDIVGLFFLTGYGLITLEGLKLAAVSLPALVVGVAIGSRMAGRFSEKAVRTGTLYTLLAMAVVMAAQSL